MYMRKWTRAPRLVVKLASPAVVDAVWHEVLVERKAIASTFRAAAPAPAPAPQPPTVRTPWL